MPFHFHRRTTRLTAVAMLFVWLLAVGTGMANACLANEDHARHGHLHHQDGAPADQSATEAQPDPHVQPTSPAKASCQSFCASAQSSVFKQHSDEPGSLDAGPIAIAWLPASPPPYRHSLWADRFGPAVYGPSIAILFLRLTL